MVARIFKPSKTAMQSGKGSDSWVLEYEPESKVETDPLMGWASSSDMRSQIRMKFPTRDEAIKYAERLGVPYRISEPKKKKRKPKAYTENFRHDRKVSWTH